MKTIFNTLLIVCGIFGFNKGYSQTDAVFDTQFFRDGVPVYGGKNNNYRDVIGSPYFYDTWAKGEAKLSDGKTYKDMFIKYDEVTGTVMFKYAMTDSAMTFTIPALEFKISYIDDFYPYNVKFISGIPPIDGGTAATFYQVVADGKAKLLKRTVKTVVEHKDFSSNVITKQISDSKYYYVVKVGSQPVRIKVDKKAIIAALSDQADKVKQFIAGANLNFEDDEDLGKIFNYYNGL